MEKYCKSCGRVFKNSDFKICPYCGNQLSERVGRQPIPRQLRHQVFQRDNYRCRECGATNKQTRLHVDHIVPVAKGGTNDLSNLQILCEACNRAKYTDEWIGGDISQINIESKYVKNAKKCYICGHIYNSKKYNTCPKCELIRPSNYKKCLLCGYKYNFILNKECPNCKVIDDEDEEDYFDSITETQLKILSNHYNTFDSPNEIIDYIINHYSENQINSVLMKLEKAEKTYNKLYSLTDSQLKILKDTYRDYNSKEELFCFLSYKYSESEMEKILFYLQKKKK